VNRASQLCRLSLLIIASPSSQPAGAVELAKPAKPTRSDHARSQ